jgi:hypothetical protein
VTVDEAGDTNSVETEGDGRFRFEPVAPGEYRVFASAGGETARATPLLTASAGGRDLTLVLEPALELKVRFVGLVAEGDTWTALTFDGEATQVEGVQVENGVATFRRLHPSGTYQIYLRLDADPSRIAFRRRISARAGEITIPFESARSIRGRLVAPRGATGFGVRARQDGLSFDGQVDADGRFEVLGLPDGTFHLRGWAALDGAQVHGEGEAAAGGSLDIELRPR